MVKTVPSRAGAAGLILGVGAKMPHALWPQNQNIKQYCNEVNKDFKMANIKKNQQTVHATKWLYLKNILNERSKLQRPHIV